MTTRRLPLTDLVLAHATMRPRWWMRLIAWLTDQTGPDGWNT